MRCCGTLALLLFGSACDASPQGIGTTDDGRDYFPAEQWRSAQPRALGFDDARFARMLREARDGRFGSLHGLIVIRNGYVAAEEYYNWAAATPHTIAVGNEERRIPAVRNRARTASGQCGTATSAARCIAALCSGCCER